jgi:hypothetical protein
VSLKTNKLNKKNMNKPQISFEIVYYDDHLIQVEVKASNGRYAGVATFYSNADGEELIEFGEKLRGFPKEFEQIIECEFGATKNVLISLKERYSGYKTVMSYVGLKFFCMDRNGHTAVDIILQEDNWTEREEARGKASFELQFDPASLDQFIQELFILSESKEGQAVLLGRIDDKDNYM